MRIYNIEISSNLDIQIVSALICLPSQDINSSPPHEPVYLSLTLKSWVQKLNVMMLYPPLSNIQLLNLIQISTIFSYWKKLSTHALLWFCPLNLPSLDGLGCSWDHKFMHSQNQTLVGPCKSWGDTPNIGNPITTEAESKNHPNLWKIWKVSKNPSSTLV